MLNALCLLAHRRNVPDPSLMKLFLQERIDAELQREPVSRWLR